MDFQQIALEIETFEAREFHGGVDDSLIDRASAAIGLPFPPTYREFLRRLGCGYVSFQEFIGLGGPDHLDVVKETLQQRERSGTSRFPLHLIPVLSDGFGNYECIDTASPTDGGEFNVVNWLHDGGDEQDCEVIAESYLAWFRSVLQMIKAVDAQGDAEDPRT
jgi:antitoxin YobK